MDLIELLKSYEDPILSTYSIKYLGVTEGKIGILSRRLPLPKPVKEKKPLERRYL